VYGYWLTAGLHLRADAIHTASALLQSARVPVEIVMNDVATEAMQIDTLGHDVGRNKYLWEEGTVERKHKALPGLTTGSPINQADIGKEHRAILSLVLIVAQCGDIAGLHCVDRAKQRLAFAGAAASLQELKKL